MADIFDKCVRFQSKTRLVKQEDRAAAENVLYRRAPIDNAGPWIEIDGRSVLQMSTNDYLGLAKHRSVRDAAVEVVQKYGVSAPMGARVLTGHTALHEELERFVADFKKTEGALVFGNGAHTMMGTIAALANSRDLVILDRYAHASLVCGAKMSGARIRFFAHNDVESLEALLLEAHPDQAKMVVVDGVYSMHGDLAPLPILCDLCDKHGARLIVDDAHGTGVLGANGRGTAELLGVEDRVDLHLGTFSKAAGTIGGFVAGDRAVLNYLKYHAPTILFTKAMPACIVAATIVSMKLLAEARDERANLWRNAQLLQSRLRELGYYIGNTQSPITPIHGNGTDSVHVCKALFEEYNIWASAALYPAVPIGKSIVRVIPTANHSPQDLELFLDAMARLKMQQKPPSARATSVPAAGPEPRRQEAPETIDKRSRCPCPDDQRGLGNPCPRCFTEAMG